MDKPQHIHPHFLLILLPPHAHGEDKTYGLLAPDFVCDEVPERTSFLHDDDTRHVLHLRSPQTCTGTGSCIPTHTRMNVYVQPETDAENTLARPPHCLH